MNRPSSKWARRLRRTLIKRQWNLDRNRARAKARRARRNTES